LKSEHLRGGVFNRLIVLIAVLGTASCTQGPPAAARSSDSGAAVTPDRKVRDQQGIDWDAILKLEAEAKALVTASGCSRDDQCRTAPVGSRGCGGPRYYLTYCARSTDSLALFRKLREVENAERAFNEKYKIGSTCEFRMPPAVGITAGECRAK
jgi:hypothetical protein